MLMLSNTEYVHAAIGTRRQNPHAKKRRANADPGGFHWPIVISPN